LGPKSPAASRESRDFVRHSKEEGADFIKILSDDLPRDIYFAIAEEARKQGIPFSGHVPYSISAGEASDAGQLSLEHKYAISIPCSELEEEVRARLERIDSFRERIKALADIEYDPQRAQTLLLPIFLSN